MYAGRNDETKTDDIIFLSINAYWEDVTQHLPELSAEMNWNVVVDTWEEESVLASARPVLENTTVLKPRSVQVLVAVPNN